MIYKCYLVTLEKLYTSVSRPDNQLTWALDKTFQGCLLTWKLMYNQTRATFSIMPNHMVMLFVLSYAPS